MAAVNRSTLFAYLETIPGLPNFSGHLAHRIPGDLTIIVGGSTVLVGGLALFAFKLFGTTAQQLAFRNFVTLVKPTKVGGLLMAIAAVSYYILFHPLPLLTADEKRLFIRNDPLPESDEHLLALIHQAINNPPLRKRLELVDPSPLTPFALKLSYYLQNISPPLFGSLTEKMEILEGDEATDLKFSTAEFEMIVCGERLQSFLESKGLNNPDPALKAFCVKCGDFFNRMGVGNHHLKGPLISVMDGERKRSLYKTSMAGTWFYQARFWTRAKLTLATPERVSSIGFVDGMIASEDLQPLDLVGQLIFFKLKLQNLLRFEWVSSVDVGRWENRFFEILSMQCDRHVNEGQIRLAASQWEQCSTLFWKHGSPGTMENTLPFRPNEKVVCSALVAKLIGQAIQQMNQEIRQETGLGEDPFMFPFPSTCDLNKVAPADFIHFPAFEIVTDHLGKLASHLDFYPL